MPFVLIRQKVRDAALWESGYDQHRAIRQQHGCRSEQVFCLDDDKSTYLVLLEWDDLSKARSYAQTDELREAMQKAGVIGQPEFYFLDEVEKLKAIGGEPGAESVARQLIDGFNRREFDRALSVISDQAEWLDVATGTSFKGKDGYRQYDERWLRAFPDGTIEYVSSMVSGNRVFVEYIGRGTHTGALSGPHGDVAPTGKKIEVRLCDILEIKNGQIIRGRTYYDSATLLAQIGQLALPKKAA